MYRKVVFGMATPTMAYKANSILLANGFDSQVVRLDKSKAGTCVYGVAVYSNADNAHALLRKSGINPTDIQR